MRVARSQDYWKKARRGCSQNTLSLITFSNVAGIGTGSLEFKSSINVLCGKNGLGKSTLLKGIAATLNSDLKVRFRRTESRIQAGKLKASITDIEGNNSVYDFSCDSNDAQVAYLDTSEACQIYLDAINSEKDLEGAVSQVGFGPLGNNDQKQIKRILGRDYTQIEYAELDDIKDEEVIPYFRVTRRGVVYESPNMALGELSILYLCWLINREPRGTVFLIEEPENFLTPHAQRYVCDYLAFCCVSKGSWFLISTHSEHIVERVGLDNTQVLVEGDNSYPVVIKSPRHNYEYLQHLGLSPKKKGIILVEDTSARIAVNTAFQHFGSFIKHDYEVVKIGGTAAIHAILKNFPEKSEFNVVGIYDGNERENFKYDDAVVYSFLPTDLSPEEALKELVLKDTPAAADHLRVRFEALRDALSVVEGDEPHDWLGNLSTLLGMDYPECLKGLCSQWVATEEQEFSEILRVIDSSESMYGSMREARERPSGSIKFYDRKKGFGFIQSDSHGDLFFRKSSISPDTNVGSLESGITVDFDFELSIDKPNHCAINVSRSDPE
ncbi:AAA family ATPase [Marinobacter sp. NFXS11]|uniref:cold shock domain-containing protein n=1 Tax=Marinobacter sp. NFXS11 TaxID=2818432 RepID=UPI0032DE45B7